MFTTLIQPTDLLDNLDNPQFAIVDCRFTLGDPEKGRQDYQDAHIPGAVYAHLNDHLCGTINPKKTGRHPLPNIDDFVETLSSWGIGPDIQVVSYDDVGGALAGARLWWMLRWLGHKKAAVLNGGWTEWQKQGLPVKSGIENREYRKFEPRVHPELLADTHQVDQMRHNPDSLVLDSRTFDRYRGENETIDPVAGHIPGARPAPYPLNLDSQEKFLSREELRSRFENILDGIAAENIVFYCGSGVTAAHNVLAVAHAGLGEAKLYAGSWSKWITDPSRPVATGEDQ